MTDPELSAIDPSHPAPTHPLPVSDFYVLSKQIDELGGEWTFPIFIQRAINFHFGWPDPFFYEQVSSFNTLGLEAILQARANEYCPPEMCGDMGVMIEVYPSIFDSEDGIVPMPSSGERSIGKHFVAVVGVEDPDTLIIRNSWSGWRREAGNIGYLTSQYFEEHGIEGMVSRPWGFGPDADTVEALLQCEDQHEFIRMWRRRRRRGTDNSFTNVTNLTLHWYGCWSLDLESPAEILVVRMDRRVSVATAILIHRKDDSTSELTDFFVWPSYRRQGYGLLLERFASERAGRNRSSHIGIYLWSSDTAKGKDRAISFMRAAGYRDIEEFSGAQAVAYGKRSLI